MKPEVEIFFTDPIKLIAKHHNQLKQVCVCNPIHDIYIEVSGQSSVKV